MGEESVGSTSWGKLEELAPSGSTKRVESWQEVEKGMGQIAAWLKAGLEEGEEERLFFMGNTVGITYADIRLASFLLWFKACFGRGSEEWGNIMAWDGGRWARFMTAFESWEVVDDGDEGDSWIN